MKVIKITVQELDNAGCNNGNYPRFKVTFNNGATATGTTCRCGNGCSGTSQLPEIGQEFSSLDDFWDYAG